MSSLAAAPVCMRRCRRMYAQVRHRENQYHVDSLTIKGDTDLATVLLLEVVAIRLDCGTVSKEEVVTHNPRLSAAVALLTLAPVTRASGRKQSGTITQNGTAPWLVEGDP